MLFAREEESLACVVVLGIVVLDCVLAGLGL